MRSDRIALVLILMSHVEILAQCTNMVSPVDIKEYVGSSQDFDRGFSTLYRDQYINTRTTYYEGVGSHPGIDITHDRSGQHFTTNTPVFAICDGVVDRVTKDGLKDGGWGNSLTIRHEVPNLGNIYSAYAHLGRFTETFSIGDAVSAGEQIGFVGRTGRASGIHLHFQIDNDMPPRHPYFPDRFPGTGDGDREVNYPDSDRRVADRTLSPLTFVQERLSGIRRILIYYGNGGVSPYDIDAILGYGSGVFWDIKSFYESNGFPTTYTPIFPPDLTSFKLAIFVMPGRHGDAGINFFGGAQVVAIKSFLLAGNRLVILGDWGGHFGINTINDLLSSLGVTMRQNPDGVTPDADTFPPLTDVTHPDQITDGVNSLDFSATSSISVGNAKSLLRVQGTSYTVLAVEQVSDSPPRPGGEVILAGDSQGFDDFTFRDLQGDGVGDVYRYALNLVDFTPGSPSSTTYTHKAETPLGGPTQYALSQNYPNPFNPRTEIEYSLPEESEVSLIVYNTLGQEVATLVTGNQAVGHKAVIFDASSLPSGVYYYKLRTSSFLHVNKMLLAK